MQEAVDYAVQHDAVVVASAGNWGDENNPSVAPANCLGVLAVGAIDGQLAPWPMLPTPMNYPGATR